MPAPSFTDVARRASNSLLAAAAAALILLAAARVVRPAATPLSPGPPGLDPNSATREELVLLPGIGDALAERIIGVREAALRAPVFRSADDLGAVGGIGPATIERLRPHLLFSAAPPDSRVRARAVEPAPVAPAEDAP